MSSVIFSHTRTCSLVLVLPIFSLGFSTTILPVGSLALIQVTAMILQPLLPGINIYPFI